MSVSIILTPRLFPYERERARAAFLEKTLALLREHDAVAALAGDLATENDATRMRVSAKSRESIDGWLRFLVSLGAGMI